jgi:hypothetical protein
MAGEHVLSPAGDHFAIRRANKLMSLWETVKKSIMHTNGATEGVHSI